VRILSRVTVHQEHGFRGSTDARFLNFARFLDGGGPRMFDQAVVGPHAELQKCLFFPALRCRLPTNPEAFTRSRSGK
jgi:hypothetical protein